MMVYIILSRLILPFMQNCQGGIVLMTVLKHMNSGGRIAYCTSNFNHGRNKQGTIMRYSPHVPSS